MNYIELIQPAVKMELTQPAAKKAKTSRIRYPNWEKRETLVLVKSYKQQMDEYNAAAIKGRMSTSEQKWERISSLCTKEGVSRDNEQCRKRWQDLSKKYKKIKDWEENSRQESYWLISSTIRKEKNVPSSFDKEVYDNMESFMGSKSLDPKPLMLLNQVYSAELVASEIQDDHDVPSSSHGGPSNIIQNHLEHESLGDASLQDGTWALSKERMIPSKRHCPNCHAESDSYHLAEALESATRIVQERCSQQLTEVLADTLSKIADAIKTVAENMQTGLR